MLCEVFVVSDLKNNISRVNIRVSQKIKKYFELKSYETGVSQSALMALALDEYIDQKIMLDFTKKIGSIECTEENK